MVRAALPNTQGFINLEMHGNGGQVEAMLDHLERKLDPVNIGQWMATYVNPFIRERARNRFTNEGDAAVGGPWAPLKQATEQFRSSQGYGASHPINKRTGELEMYVTSSPLDITIEPAVGARLTMPGRPASGELLKKMKTAQQGDGRTVARPVIALNEEDLVYTMGSLVDYVTRGLL